MLSDYSFIYSNSCKTITQWKSEGGTLLGEKDIGCGVNVLTFLDIIERRQGETMVRKLQSTGTSFIEMLNNVQKKVGDSMKLEEYKFEVEENRVVSQNKLKAFYEFVLNRFPDNSCIMIKMNSWESSMGHSLVLQKRGRAIWTIDPHNEKEVPTYDLDNPERTMLVIKKIADIYTRVGLISFSLGAYKKPVPILESVSVHLPESKTEHSMISIQKYVDKNNRLLSQDFVLHLNLLSNEIGNETTYVFSSVYDIVHEFREEIGRKAGFIEKLNEFKIRVSRGERIIIDRRELMDAISMVDLMSGKLRNLSEVFQSRTILNGKRNEKLTEIRSNLLQYKSRVNNAISELLTISEPAKQSIILHLENILNEITFYVEKIERSSLEYSSMKNEIDSKLFDFITYRKVLENSF